MMIAGATGPKSMSLSRCSPMDCPQSRDVVDLSLHAHVRPNEHPSALRGTVISPVSSTL
jgi:hypothetical protein